MAKSKSKRPKSVLSHHKSGRLWYRKLTIDGKPKFWYFGSIDEVIQEEAERGYYARLNELEKSGASIASRGKDRFVDLLNCFTDAQEARVNNADDLWQTSRFQGLREMGGTELEPVTLCV